MKKHLFLGVLAAALLLSGCAKKSRQTDFSLRVRFVTLVVLKILLQKILQQEVGLALNVEQNT